MKTAELTDLALDWAVAKSADLPFPIVYDEEGRKVRVTPSTDWAQGGPIIERERIGIRDDGGDGWAADDYIHATMHGDTPLIAAMRCFVASRLGDDVDVPKEVA